MKKIGFVISNKENEFRRCITPDYIECIKNKDFIKIETGYGNCLGFSDDDYKNAGVQIVTREEALCCDIICDPKIGDADYVRDLNSQTLFGWLHAVQNKELTDIIIERSLTAYAWEDMFSDGRHVFWRNNEVAGEAAVMHAFQVFGIMPYNLKVAVLGVGNVAVGALKILTSLGADVVVYNRRMEHLFRAEIEKYDVLVNAILWDSSRKDHVIYKTDLARMKPGAMIIDISCDRNGAIETSILTSIENPTYEEDGVWHYVVDHTPALFYKTVSDELAKVVAPYCDQLICDDLHEVLSKACIIENGNILDQRIIGFQNR